MFMWLIHKTGHSGATSQTVATCGGEAVCVIDCQTGIVLHKYKVPGEVSAGALCVKTAGSWDRSPDSIPHDFILVGMEPRVSAHYEPFPQLVTALWELLFLSLRLAAPGEPPKQVAPRSLLTTIFPSFHPCQEFFSVAWTALTVVTQAGHKKRWNMLAAAGLRGMVRLLHVRAGFCCSVIRAHKKAIATLCFSPTHESHLFSKTLNPELPQHRRLSALVPCVSFWG